MWKRYRKPKSTVSLSIASIFLGNTRITLLADESEADAILAFIKENIKDDDVFPVKKRKLGIAIEVHDADYYGYRRIRGTFIVVDHSRLEETRERIIKLFD